MRSTRSIAPWLVMLAVSMLDCLAVADELKGANAVLEQAGAAAKGDAAPTAKPKTPQDAWNEKAAALAAGIAQLPVDQACAEWLALFDDAVKSRALRWGIVIEDADDTPQGFAALIAALPRPQHWTALAAAIDARPKPAGVAAVREDALRVLGHLLAREGSADEAAIWQLVDQIRADFPALGINADGNAKFALDSLEESLRLRPTDPDRVVAAFENKLADIEGKTDPMEIERTSFHGAEFPDLVALVGEERARPLLRRAVALPVIIAIPEGEKTRVVAGEEALAAIGELKKPQWKLCWSLDAAPLFEALWAKFPADTSKRDVPFGGDLQPRLGAATYYLMHLIATGRIEDARRFAAEMTGAETRWTYHMYGRHDADHSALGAILAAGQARAALDFLREFVSANPTSPLVETYANLALKLGDTKGVTDALRAALVGATMNDQSTGERRLLLRQVLLSEGKVQEYIDGLKARIGPDKPPQDAQMAIAELAEFALNSGKPEWVVDVVDLVKSEMKDPQEAWTRRSSAALIVRCLIAMGRSAEAEAMLADELKAALAQPQSEWDDDTNVAEVLRRLVALYGAAGRHEDVVALLDKAPWWGVSDIAGLARDQSYGFRYGEDESRQPPLLVIVGRALAAVGRKDDARRVARLLITTAPQKDAGYEILCSTDGAAAIPYLEQRFARDRFEERPLIWKAHLLRLAGRIDEAAASIDQAIAIDPSDGEQGAGSRMRAYAELAEIRAAQGRATDEVFLRDVVAAIRLAEDADRYRIAGMVKEAIDGYREALKKFNDAYCIQSRLALELAASGRRDEALVHFRRAFELMPESFGRIESHCIGCEGVFGVAEARAVADEVFTRLAKEKPNDARVQYMLGMLRQSQDRLREARDAFVRATKLDPDYYNAWSQLRGLAYRDPSIADLRDEAEFRMYELRPNDPNGAWGQLRSVSDLRRLWKLVESAPPNPEEPLKSVVELPASKAQLSKVSDAARAAGAPRMRRGGGMVESISTPPPRTPSDFVAKQDAMSALSRLIDMTVEIER